MLSTFLVATVLAGIVCAQTPSAVALDPSDDWYGVDGNWSTVAFQVGTAPQPVNVLVSTSLSEFWVVNANGCVDNDPLCTIARGNVFKRTKSRTWDSLGAWQLGLDYLGYGGNGDYGLDTVSTTPLMSGNPLSMNDVITASINTTDYFLGFFGLGITMGNFGNRIASSPLMTAVKTYGRVPSYSYGYTAGAYYKGSSGTPCSLTLGGYDTNRFVPHLHDFNLDPSDGLPHALVRGIEVTAGPDKAVPGGWDSRTRILSNMTNAFNALIDSSTPYLWLPDAVCDQFAAAFNLTWNSTLNLYTVTNEQFADFQAGSSSYNFTFSFTSHDNTDDYVRPLEVPGVVNITITAAAFAQVLRYPFMNEVIKYGEPAVPYFPLRRASNLTNTFIIGRTFLQEAYLITRYDYGIFSVHQARFPDNAEKNIKLATITRPANSPYPGPTPQQTGLTTAQMVGIAAGAVAAFMVLVVVWHCYRRQKKAKTSARSIEEGKDAASSIMPEPPKSPMAKMFSKILGRKKPNYGLSRDAMGSASPPVEVAADANHAVYEMPVYVEPVELDGDDSKSIHEYTECGTQETQNLDTYEAARRKVEIQLQGPVPAYTPPEDPADFPPPEKPIQDMSPVATYRPVDFDSGASASCPASPISPTACDRWSGRWSSRRSLPSPMSSSRGEWTNRMSDLPSPLTEGHTYSSPTFTVSNFGQTIPRPVSTNSEAFAPSRSNSAKTAPPSGPLPLLPATPPSIYQPAPINPSNVVCVGPLPGNVTLAQPEPIAPLTQGRQRQVPEILAERRLSTDTLGSNFTEFEEQLMAQELTRQTSLPEMQPRRSRSADPDVSRSQGRLDGLEWIHVPQIPERRYSWEE